MIVAFTFLVIGQATAKFIEGLGNFEADVAYTFTSVDEYPDDFSNKDLYHGVYEYTLTNLEGGYSDVPLYWFSLYFENSVYIGDSGADNIVKTIDKPGGWMTIVTPPNQFNEYNIQINFSFSNPLYVGESGDFAVAVAFRNEPIPDPVPNQFYDVNWVIPGADASGLQTHPNTNTPEPATLLLIGIGLIAIAGYAAKKKKEVE
jgi:hypothetical protein